MNESKLNTRQVRPGVWTPVLYQKNLSTDEKFDRVMTAATQLENDANRNHFKLASNVLKSPVSTSNFARSPHLS